MEQVDRGLMIDGVEYFVPMVSVQRNFDVLDKYADRNEDGVLMREILGVYANFTLNFGIVDDKDLYEKLIDKLTEPVGFHKFVMPTNTDNDFSFDGYISQVSDGYEKFLSSGVSFQALTCKFTMKEPYRRP